MLKRKSLLFILVIVGYSTIMVTTYSSCNSGQTDKGSRISSGSNAAEDSSLMPSPPNESASAVNPQKPGSPGASGAKSGSGADTMKATNRTTTPDATKGKKHAKISVSRLGNNVAASGGITKGNDGVYDHAEVMPQFPGGEDALDNYVINHLNYPNQATADDVTGTIRVSFVVDENGNVVSPRVVGNKLGGGVDEEAVRVIKQMPRWKPGKVKGKSVKTRLELPITFELS